ncbi:MAG: hypothetical protein NTY34_06880 [Candidatus Omnitrophica bacterium]|nr:hypothetical protein [Candidatus Omnitrophota bacterium]
MVSIKKPFLLFTIYYLLFTILCGCTVTYPQDKIRESIVRICKQEYKSDVLVETAGRTMVIYLPLSDLMDFSFALTKTASEKINDVIFSAARVALSTDARIDFYCVIAHDIKVPELQIIIIKNVEDVKRLFANDISRGEYMKRMLIDLRWSPQAKKEQVVKEIFNRMNLDPKWQGQVMEDFFRSDPTSLGDIGYWNNKFYIKDITKPEFLAEQIANRIKLEFREDKSLKENFLLKSAKGVYVSQNGKRLFRFEVFAERSAGTTTGTIEDSDKIFGTVLSVAAHVIHGYHFKDYDGVEAFDQKEGRSIEVDPEELEAFRTKKLKLSEIGV